MNEAILRQETAKRRVEAFERQFGRGTLHLAYHAALPVVLNAELLHLIRINFFLDPPEPLPYTAETDLLLSPLCQEIGEGLYEMDWEVRNNLLERLVLEYDRDRLHQIATLLWQYTTRRASWEEHLGLERAQQLTALNFLDSKRAKQWLDEAEVYSGRSVKGDRAWFVAMRGEIERQEAVIETRQAGLPQFIGSYRILKELGIGGFATVYLAQEKNTDGIQLVALKVFHPHLMRESHLVESFDREAILVAKLNHNNIIKILEIGSTVDTHYIAMEYIAGGSLSLRLRERGRLTRREAMHIIKSVGDALSYTHNNQIIHRDLKPSNILLDIEQTPMRPVLTDFGLVDAMSENPIATLTSPMMGTPYYMAPEQWEGQALSPRTDLYALAIIFFEMLTDQHPYEGNTAAELMRRHIMEPFPALSEKVPSLDTFFDDVLKKAAVKDPADRYQSVAEFVKALEEANERATQFESLKIEVELKNLQELPSNILKGLLQEFCDQLEINEMTEEGLDDIPAMVDYLADYLEEQLKTAENEYWEVEGRRESYPMEVIVRFGKEIYPIFAEFSWWSTHNEVIDSYLSQPDVPEAFVLLFSNDKSVDTTYSYPKPVHVFPIIFEPSSEYREQMVGKILSSQGAEVEQTDRLRKSLLTLLVDFEGALRELVDRALKSKYGQEWPTRLKVGRDLNRLTLSRSLDLVRDQRDIFEPLFSASEAYGTLVTTSKEIITIRNALVHSRSGLGATEMQQVKELVENLLPIIREVQQELTRPHLVRIQGEPEVYLISENVKHLIPDGPTLEAFATWDDVIFVSQQELEGYQNGIAIPSVAQGETEYVEFKLDLEQNSSKLARDIAAFANSGGGAILYGVTDGRRIVGITDFESQRSVFMNHINQAGKMVNPVINSTVQEIKIGANISLIILIVPSSEQLHTVEDMEYVRVGGQRQEVDQFEKQVADIFRAVGAKFEQYQHSTDTGVDIYIEWKPQDDGQPQRLAVQVKRTERLVDIEAIISFAESAKPLKETRVVDALVYVSRSGFTPTAQIEAQKLGIRLFGLDTLKDFLRRGNSFTELTFSQEDEHPTTQKLDKANVQILIVSDDSDIRKLMAMILQIQGYPLAQEASSGQEALMFLNNKPYDLMVLDSRISDIGWVELIERAHEAQPELPVIVSSTRMKDTTITAAMDAQIIADHITMPFSPDQLVDSVTQALHKAGNR